VPAGVERMPFGRFLGYTAAGSLLWNSLLVGAGYASGSQWHRVEEYVGVLQYGVVAAIVVAVGWFVVTRVRRSGVRTMTG
jgi:membrane protein DedA with SNARE-associated domain